MRPDRPGPSLLIAALLLGALAATAASQETDLVITGATLIDGTGAEPRPGTTIRIGEGRILDVTDDASAPVGEDTRLVDADGRTVIPGLVDMHVHLGEGGMNPRDPQTSDRVLAQLLHYGVTTVFSVGGSGGDASQIRRLRERSAAGELEAPHLYATGSMLTLPGSHPVATIMGVPEGEDPRTYDWSTRGVALVETLEEARAAVRRNAETGMEAIKIIVESGPPSFGDDHPQMSLEMIDAIVDEAESYDLPVVAHVSSLDELEVCIDGGVRAVMHAAFDPFPGPSHRDRMRERKVFYVPTLSLYAALFSDRWTRSGSIESPFLREGVSARVLESLQSWQPPTSAMPTAARARLWEGMLASIDAAHEAGVAIALGTDTNNPYVFPGYSVHVELELLVEAGLTEMEALVAATRRPAEMLERGDEFGTIAPGRRADLLVLGGDPLEDIRNTRRLELVICDGEVVDRRN